MILRCFSNIKVNELVLPISKNEANERIPVHPEKGLKKSKKRKLCVLISLS